MWDIPWVFCQWVFRWSEARSVPERAACSECWPETAAHRWGGGPEQDPLSPSAAQWEPGGAGTGPVWEEHTHTNTHIRKSVIKKQESKSKNKQQPFHYLSFFLSPFFSMKPHTSAQTSMLLRKSSIVCREQKVKTFLSFLSLYFSFTPNTKAADDVTDWKQTYFAVQAVVQLHQRRFGLLW